MNQYPLIRGKTDLKTRFPEVAAQWDDEKNEGTGPEDVQPASMKKVWWRCPKGHSWRAAVYARTAGNGCPYCAGNTLDRGVNDLLTVAPEIAGQWDAEKNGSLGPQDVTAGNRRKAWWICPRGHSWEASVASRVSGKGCPYCAGRKVMPGFNDLATADPDLAKQWNDEMNGGLSPHDVTGTSHAAVWWTGKCGHVWKATVANRRYGSGCPYCCGKKVLEGFNDAKSNYPEFIGEWDYEKNEFLPEQVSVSSQKEIWWKCSKSHSWKAKLPARRNGSGCPYCGNRRVAQGENDFASRQPELLKEWDYEKNRRVLPENITYQSRKKVWWICEKGHSWKAEIYHRSKGTGCPVCAKLADNHPVKAGETDLATISPGLASEWDYGRNRGLSPEQVRPFSTRKVWWVCSRGHHWQCTVQIRQRGTGCPFCDGRIHRQSRLI